MYNSVVSCENGVEKYHIMCSSEHIICPGKTVSVFSIINHLNPLYIKGLRLFCLPVRFCSLYTSYFIIYILQFIPRYDRIF